MSRPRLIFWTSIVCLFVSGVAGLVYEIVWARYLALILGHTSHAIVCVLVAFMGGLAVGNAWLGKFADRAARPLKLYAWLEIAIGVFAMSFPAYFELCRAEFLSLANGLAPGSLSILLLKFAFSLLMILIPTVLMGGTLPILVRQLTRSLGEIRYNVAILYCMNSAGAVVGCLLADFWWIPALGLQACVWAGAVLNLLVGALALLASSWLTEGSAIVATDRVQTETVKTEQFSESDLRLVVIAIGASGFVAMLYEVVWTRLLALALGSSNHAFSLMLVTFITGIAAGSAIVGFGKRKRGTIEVFAWAEIGLAATLFVSMFYYERLPYWFMSVAQILARSDAAYPVYQIIQAMVCFLVMFLPAILLGMTLPLASRVAAIDVARAGRAVGLVFAVNTLGTVLGAAITGIWLMPWLGLAKTLGFGIALNLVVGGALISRKRPRLQPILLCAAPVAVAAMVAFAGAYFDSTWQAVFTAGLWRRPSVTASYAAFRADEKSHQIRYYRDGAGATVSVNSWRTGTNETLNLKVNGKPDASSSSDMGTQLMLAHVPLLLHPDSRQVLVVGLGSGITCAAALQHPSVQRLDVIEISPEVVGASRNFSAYNRQVLDHPHLRVIVEDAKTFLQTTTNAYDAIISEPSNPWMAGVAGVFTREYYENCAGKLSANGLMVQWVQGYETSDEALEIVMATFSDVFPHLGVWQGSPGDLILVGSVRPIKVNLASLEDRFNHPAIQEDFRRIHLISVPVFLTHELISQENGALVAPEGTMRHSDLYPVLDYVAQRAFFLRQQTDIPAIFGENLSVRPTTLLRQYLEQWKLSEQDFQSFALYHNGQHLPDERLYRTILNRWRHDMPEADFVTDEAGKSADSTYVAELEVLRMAPRRDRWFELAETDPIPLRLYAKALFEAYRGRCSVFFRPDDTELQSVLGRLVPTDSTFRRVYWLHLAELAWNQADDGACLELGQRALDPQDSAGGPMRFELDPSAPGRVLHLMIESLLRSGRVEQAVSICRRAEKEGYVGSAGRTRDPVLALTWRKVQRAASQNQPN